MTSSERVVIVTGAAGGVGAATARLLAGRGYRVLVHYHRGAERADAVVTNCRAAGVDVFAVSADVSADDGCREVVRQAVERWGRVDALVNCAAITKFVPITDLDAVAAADFHEMFGVNTVGPFQMARAAAKVMGEGGAIVNVSSIAGQTGSGSSLPYVVSKAALNVMTLALARALAPKIRINAVLPGMIEGRWMRDGLGSDEAYQRVRDRFADLSLLGRVSAPEDIAAVIGWLLEPGSVVTGQLIVADGGFTLGRPPLAASAR